MAPTLAVTSCGSLVIIIAHFPIGLKDFTSEIIAMYNKKRIHVGAKMMQCNEIKCSLSPQASMKLPQKWLPEIAGLDWTARLIFNHKSSVVV